MTGSSGVIEVVGVCGSGKSTLTQALCAADGAEPAAFLQLKRPDHWIPAASGAVRSLPLVGPALRARRLPDLEEAKQLAYLAAWHSKLASEGRKRRLVVDQGPIYALGTFGRTLPSIAGTEPGGTWWTETIRRWAHTLAVIVWLDAPDDVLMERVRLRKAEHVIKRAD
ncbi:MAG: hypothetical protein ACR2P0_14355, partial [Acidimicrobiales bacterium]